MSTFRSVKLAGDRYMCVCGESYFTHKTDFKADDYGGIRDDGTDPYEKCPNPAPTQNVVDSTIDDRGSKYGSFAAQCEIIASIEDAMHHSKNWLLLADDMKESLGMIASKVARVLNGDPNYVDSWHDIGGYARLIEKRLEGDKT